MNIKSKEIQTYLGSLNECELRFIELQINIVRDIENLVKKFKVRKEYISIFCLDLPKDYPEKKLANVVNNFCKGNFTYSLNTIASLQALYAKEGLKKLQEQAKVKFTDIKSND